MNEKYKSLGKDIFIFALGTLGSKLILFLLVPLYTNVLSKSEYGTADLVFTVAQLLIPCVSLTVYDAVLRFGLMKNVHKGDVLYAAFAVFLAGSLLTVAAVPLLMLYRSVAPWVVYLVLYVIVSFASQVMLLYLKAKDLNKLYSLLAIVQAGLLIVFNVLFLLVLKTGIGGYLMSNILSCVGVTVLAFVLGRAKDDLRKAKWNVPLLKEMIRYSAPLVVNSISWWAIHSSDKVMLEAMVGPAMLGLYTVASKIPSLLSMATMIFNQAWGLFSVKEYESTNDKKMYSNIFSMFSTVMFAAFMCICIILRPFMSVFVGAEYYDAWQYVPMLLLSACFAAFSGFCGSMYSAVKKSVNVMATTILAGASNLLVNFLLIPTLGIWGAAIGTLVAYVVITVVRMIDIHRYVPLDYHLKTFIPLSVVALAVAVLYSFQLQSLLTVSAAILLMLMIDHKNYILLVQKAVSLAKGLKRRK